MQLNILISLCLLLHGVFAPQIAQMWGAPAAAAISLAGRDYQRTHPQPAAFVPHPAPAPAPVFPTRELVYPNLYSTTNLAHTQVPLHQLLLVTPIVIRP